MNAFHRRGVESIEFPRSKDLGPIDLGPIRVRDSRVSLAIMAGRRPVSRRNKTRIDVAEAAIAGDHVWHARLDGAKLAIPLHVAVAKTLHRAPRRIADGAGVGGRNAGAHNCRQQAGQCADGFHGLSLGRHYPEATRNAHDAGKLIVAKRLDPDR
jgi:hypothetical protein